MELGAGGVVAHSLGTRSILALYLAKHTQTGATQGMSSSASASTSEEGEKPAEARVRLELYQSTDL